MIALLAILGVIIATSAAWIVHLRLGPPLDGWTAGATVLFVPLVVVMLIGAWLVVRAALASRIAWRPLTATLTAAGATFVAVGLFCGPVACFQNRGTSHAMGWFLVAGVSVAALAYERLTTRRR